MKLFYSWQSDTEEKCNRYFIQTVLEQIAKDFSDENVMQINIDQATRDEPGSPNISQTILKKIDECSIFLADMTLINAKESTKKTPNPNVLIELGYAIKRHGFDKIILLFNSICGKVDDLPFDIRQNRILQYNYNGENKKEGINSLIGHLKSAILSIDRKALNSDRIGIVFYENDTDYGESVSTENEFIQRITKDRFLSSVSLECIERIKSNRKTSSWQDYLLKLIEEERTKRSTLASKAIYIQPLVPIGLSNQNYFEEYQFASLYRKNSIRLSFALKNNNEKSFENVKIVFSTDIKNNIIRWCDMPGYPSNSPLLSAIHSHGSESSFRIDKKTDKINFEYDIELLHIGEVYEFGESLYLLLHPETNENCVIYYSILFMDIPKISGELNIQVNFKNVREYFADELFEL
ncbi:hypothetical protein FACS189462_0720 [Spirochaetia bacterium]|nr:hypothetical protein FACS189462_0720 [Spirochaetia bacterium]